MSASSRRIDRRTLLRGAGVACALPWLEAMSFGQDAAAALPRRMACVYFPNGCSLPAEDDEANAHWRWFPSGEGRDFQFTKVLEPLEAFQPRVSVLGGLSHPKSRQLLGHLAGDTWLTAGDLRGDQYKNSVSVDQLAARHVGKHTRIRSLVLSGDGGVGYKSRVSTLSFNENGKPIPSEHRHRAIFERYFAPNQGATTEERRKSLAQERKVVDLILEDSKALSKRLGQEDQGKLGDYLESLSEVEAQVQRNEAWLDVPMKPFDASQLELDPDPKVDPKAYIRTMYDLMVLGFQTDLTRVMTYMIAREDGMGYGDAYPRLALGIQRGHHTISHDQHEGHWDQWGPYDRWVAEQFAYFLQRMRDTQDEHGSLLDTTQILYGSCCSTTHNARNIPLLLAGGERLGLEHGAYHRYGESTPFSNVLLGMLNAMGVRDEAFGDSTERLREVFTA